MASPPPAPLLPITAVSAPGKVLLTGGYLVLDRAYTGLVLALDARIHALVSAVERDDAAPANRITVKSPQFLDAVWEYEATGLPHGQGVQVTQLNEGPPNPFVETSLSYALTYTATILSPHALNLPHNITITILADDDYYSETPTSRASRPSHFANFGVPLFSAHKTGLGSSAALVTSLTSALVLHRLGNGSHGGHDLDSDDTTGLQAMRTKLHNLAQAAHCAAQGKIGSGFDVAAAVYGSCNYRRFSPQVLEELGEGGVGSPGFAEKLFVVVEDVSPLAPWDAEITDVEIRLPKHMQLMLCDVDCGSKTPAMVKKVLQWREENKEEAELLWDEIQKNNDQIRLELKRLRYGNGRPSSATLASLAALTAASETDSPQGSPEAISSLANQTPTDANGQSSKKQPASAQQQPKSEFALITALISRTRSLLRTLTQRSGVPVEPPTQTKLLDRILESVDGVIAGVVPGAGGYDALALLLKDDVEVLRNLKEFLAVLEEERQGRLAAKTDTAEEEGIEVGKVSLLRVVHGTEGMREEEDLRVYHAWL